MLKGVQKKDFSWKLKKIKDDLVSLKKIESTDLKTAQVSSKINRNSYSEILLWKAKDKGDFKSNQSQKISFKKDMD